MTVPVLIILLIGVVIVYTIYHLVRIAARSDPPQRMPSGSLTLVMGERANTLFLLDGGREIDAVIDVNLGFTERNRMRLDFTRWQHTTGPAMEVKSYYCDSPQVLIATDRDRAVYEYDRLIRGRPTEAQVEARLDGVVSQGDLFEY